MNPPEGSPPCCPTEDFYTTRADEYREQTLRVDPTEFLTPLVERLEPGARVLDLGCGAGRDLRWLRQRGFRVSGVERSRPLAMFAREYANCPVLEADFTLLDMAAHPCEAILCIGSLVHLEPPEVARLLGRLLNALAPRGLLFVSLKEGTGTRRLPDGRVFHLWQQQALERLLRKRGDPLHFRRTVSALRPDETWLGWVVDARGGTDHVRPA
jgi:SAM-dependent methyltransferase